MEYVVPLVALMLGILMNVVACCHMHTLPEAKRYARAPSSLEGKLLGGTDSDLTIITTSKKSTVSTVDDHTPIQ